MLSRHTQDCQHHRQDSRSRSPHVRMVRYCSAACASLRRTHLSSKRRAAIRFVRYVQALVLRVRQGRKKDAAVKHVQATCICSSKSCRLPRRCGLSSSSDRPPRPKSTVKALAPCPAHAVVCLAFKCTARVRPDAGAGAGAAVRWGRPLVGHFKPCSAVS
eukprot:6183718-Pleurochrysis_carterae.AAC.2